jgi:hypothetical protein
MFRFANTYRMEMKKRNLVVMVILTIITFGVYYIYWYCSVQNQIKHRSGMGVGGFTHFILTIFTFGIYPIYWYFIIGSRIAKMGGRSRGLLIGFLYLGSLLVSGLVSGLSAYMMTGQDLLGGTADLSNYWSLFLMPLSLVLMLASVLIIQHDINQLPTNPRVPQFN